MTSPASDGRAGIDAALVHRLIGAQFPQWRDLPIVPVEFDGWDNRTYRLGEQLTVRLPTDRGYEPAIEKEHRWLPVLARSLPVPIPAPVALGRPGEGYPYRWSIRRWIEGSTAAHGGYDPVQLAVEVARFITALQRIDPVGGPAAGAHSFYRGASLAHYDDETRRSIAAVAGHLDTARATEVWQAGLAAIWDRPPVWFHGDIASGNLLVRDGSLQAVIDFGTSGVGDPACDLVIAWTLFTGPSRWAFCQQVDQDAATWARARGWALWKALIGLAADLASRPAAAAANLRLIEDLLDDSQVG